MINIVLGIALGVSTAADGISTQAAMRRCQNRCVETNPLASGKKLWPYLTINTAGVTWASIKMKPHKLWWAPMTISTGLHTFAAIHNTRISR